MTLENAPIGLPCNIVSLTADKKFRQKLETMGLIPGQSVNVLSHSGGGLIIEVKNSRLALSNQLAKCLEVA
jgi:Fe2+ transport system protein FeoA